MKKKAPAPSGRQGGISAVVICGGHVVKENEMNTGKIVVTRVNKCKKGAKIKANIVNAEETLACHGGKEISFSEGRGI